MTARLDARADPEKPGGTRTVVIRCPRCEQPRALDAYRCELCGGPLVADLAAAVSPPGDGPGSGCGIWRRRELLPRTGQAASLGEGDTPLVALPDRPRFHAKLESLNPTLSFKDRAMALAASIALDRELDGLVLASTGSAAVAAAAYAAHAGLRCRIFAADSVPGAKLAAARDHGAEVELVPGDYSDAYAAATRAERDGRWLAVTTTHRNPWLATAYRTIAAELAEQLGGSPAAVVVPVGAGPLLCGILDGFDDLRVLGCVERVPRMIGVQAAACAPLVAAASARDPEARLAAGVSARPTVADAIADPLRGYAAEGMLTLDAVSRSGGTLIALDDDAILAAASRLVRVGIDAEPAAAAALAGADALGLGETPGPTVLMITGHGARAGAKSNAR